jgi:hypothetical protein
MLDDAMIASFGFPRPLRGTRTLLRSGLELRGLVVRWLLPRRIGHFFADNRNRTHPRGYRIPDLGPHESLQRKRAEASEVTPRIATLHRTLVDAGLP